jgi:hypothetical protein
MCEVGGLIRDIQQHLHTETKYRADSLLFNFVLLLSRADAPSP